MKTRNSGSATPKSPSAPKRTPPDRKATATKTDSLSSPGPRPRQTKRQAAIQTKQATTQPKEQDDAMILVDDGDEETLPAASGNKAGAKKGVKRSRGSAKGKFPDAQRIKSEETDGVENLLVSGNEDVEMKENVGDVKDKEYVDGNQIGSKEDVHFQPRVEERAENGAAELHVSQENIVNNVSEPSDAEAVKENLVTGFGELSETTNGEDGIDKKNGVRSVDKMRTVSADENNVKTVNTTEHSIQGYGGDDANPEGTNDLSGDVMEDPIGHKEIKESDESNTISVKEVHPKELADKEEDEHPVLENKVIQKVVIEADDCLEQNTNKVDETIAGKTLNAGNDTSPENIADVMKLEDEKIDNGKEGIASDMEKKYVRDGNEVSTPKGMIEGNKSNKSEEKHIMSKIAEEEISVDESKVKEIAEANVRDSGLDGQKLEEEHREWTAVAKERTIKKEHEIFIRGVDKETKEDDLRKVFAVVGEVVEVRLHKHSLINKDKGYAFVRFSDKEHVKQALSEFKNLIIGGKSCIIGPSEDNDTLFLGNICNTWTKETIIQKLKEYGVEAVENVTLVPDAQHEGFSRGFAFLNFSCHDDALLAYQKLQKPDVIFGHAERTAKVAFAEPLREPDPDVMAKVKTVFLDGLPSSCDENYLREKVKGFGQIDRIVLARNMVSAKRKDFGFVHFADHEAAVACVDGINNTPIQDGDPKTKVKARLSNPFPKIQAVKGGMAGGFRFGFSRSASTSKPGNGVGRGGHSDRQGTSEVGWESSWHQHGHTGFSNDYHLNKQFGNRGPGQGFRGSLRPAGEEWMAGSPVRPNHVRHIRDPGDSSLGMHSGSREPFPFEGGSWRHHNERQNGSYAYGHKAQGTKRPSHMTDLDPGYMEPIRRPRLNYTAPPYPAGAPYPSHVRRDQYQDSFGPHPDIQPNNYYGHPTNPYPHDYYGPPANPRPLDYFRPPANPHPHEYYGPPANMFPPYRPPANPRPHEYYGPPSNPRPHDYYGPNGGPCPSAFRGNPTYGGRFH